MSKNAPTGLTTTAAKTAAVPSPTHELSVHGLLRVHLVGANASDLKAVCGQLGLEPTRPTGRADLTIRYSQSLDPGELQLLGSSEVGFNETGFYLLRDARGRPLCMRLPFEDLGAEPVIECRHGVGRLPLLRQMLHASALAKDILPIHAAAFRAEELTALVMGWCEGGKTESLLGFLANDAEFIADDWVYLDQEQAQICGLPAPMTLCDWHLPEAPRIRRLLGWRRRLRLTALRWTASISETLAKSPIGRGNASGAFLTRLSRLLRRQLHVEFPVNTFAAGASLRAAPDVLFLVLSHTDDRVTSYVEDGNRVAAQMTACLQAEQQALENYYRMYRFAFPGASNKTLDESWETHSRLLDRFLADRPVVVIGHPHPAPVMKLREAIQSALRAWKKEARS